MTLLSCDLMTRGRSRTVAGRLSCSARDLHTRTWFVGSRGEAPAPSPPTRESHNSRDCRLSMSSHTEAAPPRKHSQRQLPVPDHRNSEQPHRRQVVPLFQTSRRRRRRRRAIQHGGGRARYGGGHAGCSRPRVTAADGASVLQVPVKAGLYDGCV